MTKEARSPSGLCKRLADARHHCAALETALRPERG
jgi:hypothetical protein